MLSKIILIIMSTWTVLCNVSWAQAPTYPNTPYKEEMSDAPWVVSIDDTIPFLFMLKDGQTDPLDEIHCLAIYDISDGIKRYAHGTRFTPQVDDCGLLCGFNLRCPPLTPNPYEPDSVPNQVYYHDFCPNHPEFRENFRYWIVDRFEHPGAKWQSLAGQPITPRNLGYQPGDVITFRIVLLGEDSWFQGNNDIHHLKDLRVRVVEDSPPLPKLAGWYLTDTHYHTWNTDNIHEYGAPLEYVAKAARKIGLDCITVTDHSCDMDNDNEWSDAFGEGNTWEHLGWEVDQYTDILFIRGEETSGHIGLGFPWDERHHLCYGIERYIWGEWGGENYPVVELADSVLAQSGFFYLAHPASYNDWAWETELWLHPACRGMQIFNGRPTFESSAGNHPWGDEPHLGVWETAHEDWDEKMIEKLSHYDGYLSTGIHPERPLKWFIIGGSDAHGDLNYSVSHPDWWSPDITSTSNMTGSFRTAVFSPAGLNRDSILNGIRNGRCVVTDGPMLIFGIDQNGDGDINDPEDLRIGDGDDNEDHIIDEKACLIPRPESNLYLQWKSNNLFGEVYKIELYRGSRLTVYHPTRVLVFYPNSYEGIEITPFRDCMYGKDDSIYYFRAVAYSKIGDEFWQTYRCFTNSIWIRWCLPQITYMYASPNPFDAVEQSTKIYFKIDSFPGYINLNIQGANRILLDNEFLSPGEYEIEWDGRDNNGKVCMPGTYIAYMETWGIPLSVDTITVKGTQISGILPDTAHWTEAGEPYVLVGDVQVPGGGRLTIDPGVKVMPAGNYGILPRYQYPYWHHIYAQGTFLNKILFTPHRKLYPTPDSIPRGFWKGIEFHRGTWEDSLIFTHCIIEGAGSDSAAFWAYLTKYVELTSCEIAKSGGFGFYCDYRCNTVRVNNCQFIDNDSIPLVVPFEFIGEVYGNSFVNNKLNVIGITAGGPSNPRDTDAFVYNQGVPYWVLKGHGWECMMRSSNYNYCPTLTVEPGVRIFFHDSSGLYLQQRSKIIAVGKPDSLIVFTALDTTKHWRGIHLNNGYAVDTSRFEFCEISYGGRPWGSEPKGNIALSDNEEAFILKNCLIARSKTYGVGDAHNFNPDTCISIVQNNTFYANDSFPLIISTTELSECRGNQFIDNRYNAILVRNGGDITKKLTIKNQGVPYVIDCWFVVNNLLEIEKGNILQFKGQRAWFKPNGILKAIGVTFTAYDTVWWGMKFDNSKLDASVLDSCIFEKARYYGGVWPRGAIDVAGSRVKVSNSAVVNNECGIYVSGASSRLILKNNLISQNRNGIRAFDSRADSLYIKWNEFLGNKCSFTTNYTYPYLCADSNWWGDETGPWDPSNGAPDYNPSGRGDSIGDYVIYRPWLTAPVEPPKVTLLQPNGGEVLYSGQGYEIRWRLGGKETIEMPKSPKYLNYLKTIKAIEGNWGQLEAEDKFQIPNTNDQTNFNIQISSTQIDTEKEVTQKTQKITDGIASPPKEMAARYDNEELNPPVSPFGKGGLKGDFDTLNLSSSTLNKSRGILRQELYYTTDFPEGGSKAEAFWRFIDTVPVGESTYIWTVPNTPSQRCRVAVKIYYDPETGRQKDKETIQIPKGPKYLSYLKTDKAIEGNWGQLEAEDKFQIPNTNDQTNFNIQISSTQIDTEKEVTQKTQKITDGIASPPEEMAARYDNEELNPPVSPFGKGGLKGDFSTFENGRIDNGSNGCMVAVDISDADFTIALTTDFDKGTAYNNGKKIVTTLTGDKIYFVYANEGITLPGGIYSCYSQDSGKTFGIPERVSDGGVYPAIGLCQFNNPCASWSSDSKLGYTYWTSSWGPPDTIVLPVENISPPSMVCDDKDTVHIVFVQYYELPSDIGDLIYMKFKKTDFSGAVIETLFTHTFCRTPSIVIDDSRNLHILWQGEKCICYQEKGSTGWVGIDTIYKTTTSERLYPVIDLYGDKIMVVWQDRVSSGNLEIYSRQKTDIGWQDIKKVATTSGESKFPTLSGGHYCLWQDNTPGNWEVYMSQYVDTSGSWTAPENISNTLTISGYPHSAYSLVNPTSAKLYCLWTEGDTIPYTIKFKKLDVSPVAKVFADLGQAVQSQYCLRRDGYWIFGNKPYQTTDWGYENLRYKFTGLDPEKVYRMDLAYYFENKPDKSRIPSNNNQTNSNIQISNKITDEILKQVQNDRYETEVSTPEGEKGIGRIIQALVVDGTRLDTIFITPNRLVRNAIWLKKESYADGEIIMDISRIKGKRVVCSEISLFEFPE